MHKGSSFSTYAPAPCFLCGFVFSHSHVNGCEVVSYCDFDLHFPDDSDAEGPFMDSLATCVSSVGKCLLKLLALIR